MNNIDDSFRWVKPAASLKPDLGPPGRVLRRPRFRWVKPAASLKRTATARSSDRQHQAFPLGKTGGLIEAPRRCCAPVRAGWSVSAG